MITEAQSPLNAVCDWIRGADVNLRHLIPLLRRVEQIVSGEKAASVAERRNLANNIERWRYQFLDESRWHPDAMARRLADVLDLAANHLAGRKPRLPRCPHDAIGDSFEVPEELARGLMCLDREVSLEAVAHRAAQVTLDHFGVASPEDSLLLRRRMLIYAPIYLTNYCINDCRYCGCRYPNQIERTCKTADEVIEDAENLSRQGVRHVMLVAGDFPRIMRPAYLSEIISELTARGLSVALDVAPQLTAVYEILVRAGASTILLHQENYDDVLYAHYHPRGLKRLYDWRLEALDRAAEAGFANLGLGILLGLAEPRLELPSLIRHALYLRARYPGRRLCFHLPRIHEAPESFVPPHPVDEATMVRLYCALRLAFPDAELMLSLREPPEIRNRLAQICVTQLSAGGTPLPGTYEYGGTGATCGLQFPIGDRRTPTELKTWLYANGFQPTT